MKLIKTPTGEIFNFDDCEIFDDILCDTENFLNVGNQKELAEELFENTGILTAIQGGGNAG